MTHSTKKTPKTDLERSALEMVKAARGLTNVKREDLFWAGICKETLKRLTRLEKQIHKHRKKSSSEAKVQEIAKELAQLIGNICKSLIRYKYHFRMQCCYFAFIGSVKIYHDNRINLKTLEDSLKLNANHFGQGP